MVSIGELMFDASKLYTRSGVHRLVNIKGRRGVPDVSARWGAPELCTKGVDLVCTLACFANGGGPKVARSGGPMADIEGTYDIYKAIHSNISNLQFLVF